MADVMNRDAKEAELVRALSREFNRVRVSLLSIIPDLDRWTTDLNPTFWVEHGDELNRIVTPLMTSNYLAQAETLLAEFEFLGVEWGLINEAAANWARQYTFELVKDLLETDRRVLQKLIPQFFEQQMTQGQLRAALQPMFGSVRAEMIARTEVTRAASEGEQGVARELAAQGIEMQPVWLTREDEIVCPICGPKANKPIEDNNYPPAHPRCRCWIGHVFKKEAV